MKRNEKAELSGILSAGLFMIACWGIWTRFIPEEINSIVHSKMPLFIIAMFIMATIGAALMSLRLSRPQDIKKIKRGKIFF